MTFIIKNHCILQVFILFKSVFLVLIENVPLSYTKQHPTVTNSTYLLSCRKKNLPLTVIKSISTFYFFIISSQIIIVLEKTKKKKDKSKYIQLLQVSSSYIIYLLFVSRRSKYKKIQNVHFINIILVILVLPQDNKTYLI